MTDLKSRLLGGQAFTLEDGGLAYVYDNPIVGFGGEIEKVALHSADGTDFSRP